MRPLGENSTLPNRLLPIIFTDSKSWIQGKEELSQSAGLKITKTDPVCRGTRNVECPCPRIRPRPMRSNFFSRKNIHRVLMRPRRCRPILVMSPLSLTFRWASESARRAAAILRAQDNLPDSPGPVSGDNCRHKKKRASWRPALKPSAKPMILPDDHHADERFICQG